jgi:hypothetical protein
MFRRFRPVWMRRRTTNAVRREMTPAPIGQSTRPRPRHSWARCIRSWETCQSSLFRWVRKSTTMPT